MKRLLGRIVGPATVADTALVLVIGMAVGAAAGAEVPRPRPAGQPEQVAAGGVVDVEAGFYHSLALTSDGTVWAWGSNEFGQLGDGTTRRHRRPVQVADLHDVVAITAGEFDSLALKSDGTIWAWGYNSDGQLGDGTTTNRVKPVQVTGLMDVVEIGAGWSHGPCDQG
jgi:alpha-tubulin suppressor-like RCC1 family protein